MFRRWRAALLFLAAIALVVSPPMSFAKDKVQFGISGFGGYNTYAMDDLNNELIDPVNADPTVAAAGISLDKVSKGFGLGGGVHAWMTKDLVISAEYERLMAGTKDEGNVLGSPVAIEIKAPASAFVLTAAHLFPSESKCRFGLGAGIGYYSTSGTLEVSGTGGAFNDKVKGNGVGFHALGVMDYAATSQVHLGVRAGYRMAKASDLEDSSGVKLLNTDGSESQADWSGLMTRAGITLLLGASE